MPTHAHPGRAPAGVRAPIQPPSHAHVLQLQRTAGNRAVANLIALQRAKDFAGFHGQGGLGTVSQPNPREYRAGGQTKGLKDLTEMGGGGVGTVGDHYEGANLVDQDALKAKGDSVYNKDDIDKYRDKPGQTQEEKEKNAAEKAGHEQTKGQIDIATGSLGAAAGFMGMYMSIRKMVAEKGGDWDSISVLIGSVLGAAAGIAGIISGADKAGGGNDKGIDLAAKITGLVSGVWGVIKGAVDTIMSGIAAVKSFMRGGKTSQFRNSADAVENLAGTTGSGLGVVKGAYDIAGQGVGALGKAMPIVSIVINAAHLIRLLVNGIVAAFQKSKMRALKGAQKAGLGLSALKPFYTKMLGKLARASNFINFKRLGKPDLDKAKMTTFLADVDQRDARKIGQIDQKLSGIDQQKQAATDDIAAKNLEVAAIPGKRALLDPDVSTLEATHATEKAEQAAAARRAKAASTESAKKGRKSTGKWFSTGGSHLKAGFSRLGMALTKKGSKRHQAAKQANTDAKQRVTTLRDERKTLASERQALANQEKQALADAKSHRSTKRGAKQSRAQKEAEQAALDAKKKKLEAEVRGQTQKIAELEASKKPHNDVKNVYKARRTYYSSEAKNAPDKLTNDFTKKYLLTREMQTIGQKRINRAISQAIPGIVDISGDITTLTGVGGPAGMIQKLVAGGAKLGLSLFRNAKQFVRDLGVGSRKKSTEGKAQRRKEMTVEILKMVAANPAEGKEYLKATGVDLKSLYQHNGKTNGVKEQAKMIYEALGQRE